jgi:hypothetical protein
MTSSSRPAPHAKMIAPSSPASRPRPAGGLRPSLDTGCGGTDMQRSGADNKEDQQTKICRTEVSTVSGIAVHDLCRRRFSSWLW